METKPDSDMVNMFDKEKDEMWHLEMSNVREENRILKQENRMLKQENHILKQEKDEEKQEIAELKDENAELKQKIDHNEAQLNEVRNQLPAVTTELNNLSAAGQANDDLSANPLSFQSQEQGIQQNGNGPRQPQEHQERTIEQQEVRLNGSEHCVDSVTAEANHLREQNVQFERMNGALTARNIELEVSNRAVTARNTELEVSNRAVTARNIELEVSNRAVVARNIELEGRNAALTADYDALYARLFLLEQREEVVQQVVRGLRQLQRHQEQAMNAGLQHGQPLEQLPPEEIMNAGLQHEQLPPEEILAASTATDAM